MKAFIVIDLAQRNSSSVPFYRYRTDALPVSASFGGCRTQQFFKRMCGRTHLQKSFRTSAEKATRLRLPGAW